MHFKNIVIITLFLSVNMTIIDAQPKKEDKQSCVSSKCHATMGKQKFVHGPVAVTECSACHQLVKNEKHKFQKIDSTASLCSACHEPLELKKNVHQPVIKGNCTGCHNPHQSNQQYFLKKDKLSEVCFTCHDKNMISKKSGHGPAMDGDCSLCHQPHSSDNEKLLLQSGNTMCFECHSDIKDNLATAQGIHKPVSESCVKCHNPHSNDGPTLLAKDIPDQCFDCHKAMHDDIDKSLVKHKAVDIDKKCFNCHQPHHTNVGKLLKDEPLTLCLSCHNKEIESPSGSLANIDEWLKKNKEWHGPIRNKDCSSCHDVHGSNFFRILKKDYPKEFYTSFDAKKYELCFSCHQPTLVQDAKTLVLTNFRDGDINLHYLHVNKKVKGRTCRACHESHASDHPKHIRDVVPFGKWNLPIRFEGNANGGSCSPGCHASKDYKRTLAKGAKK
jgi:predicted CXXCH cytochrome family protein